MGDETKKEWSLSLWQEEMIDEEEAHALYDHLENRQRLSAEAGIYRAVFMMSEGNVMKYKFVPELAKMLGGMANYIKYILSSSSSTLGDVICEAPKKWLDARDADQILQSMVSASREVIGSVGSGNAIPPWTERVNLSNVVELSLSHRYEVRNPVLELISDERKCSNLTALDVTFTSVTNEGMRHVAKGCFREKLKILNISATAVNGIGLRYLCGLKPKNKPEENMGCSALEVLRADNCLLTPYHNFMAAGVFAKTLHTFSHRYHANQESGYGGSVNLDFPNLPNLREINIGGHNIGGLTAIPPGKNALNAAMKSGRFTSVRIETYNGLDPCIPNIGNCENLHTIEVCPINKFLGGLTPSTLAALSGLSSLRHIRFVECEFMQDDGDNYGPDGFFELVRNNKETLETIDLSRTRFCDTPPADGDGNNDWIHGIYLRQCTKLTSLVLDGNSSLSSGELLTICGQMPLLTRFSLLIGDVGYSPARMVQGDHSLGNIFVASLLGSCPKLTHLALTVYEDVREEWASQDVLDKNVALSDKFVSIKLRGARKRRAKPENTTNLTDAFLARLPDECPNLLHLDVSLNDKISDEGVKHLRALPLISLRVAKDYYLPDQNGWKPPDNRRILTNDCIEGLNESLVILDISASRIDDYGLGLLAERCPGLMMLTMCDFNAGNGVRVGEWVYNSSETRTSILPLLKCYRLSQLRIDYMPFQPLAELLLANNPNLRILHSFNTASIDKTDLRKARTRLRGEARTTQRERTGEDEEESDQEASSSLNLEDKKELDRLFGAEDFGFPGDLTPEDIGNLFDDDPNDKELTILDVRLDLAEDGKPSISLCERIHNSSSETLKTLADEIAAVTSPNTSSYDHTISDEDKKRMMAVRTYILRLLSNRHQYDDDAGFVSSAGGGRGVVSSIKLRF